MPSVADTVDLVEALLTGVSVKLGEEYVNENNFAPVAVFVPKGDMVGAPRMRDRAHSSQVSIATRSAGLECHIWGAAADPPVGSYPDVRATELLVDRVIIALNTIYGGNIIWEQSDWMGASAMIAGRGYILRFRVDIPVVPTEDDAENTTTTFTDVDSESEPVIDDEDAPPAIRVVLELPAQDEEGIPSP